MGFRREVSFRELVDLPSTTYATHDLYMYPAKFIPHVVRYAIDRYTKPGDWVFDPFAGYGTVAVEASLTGRNAILWDLNPIMEFMVKASTFAEDVRLKDFEVEWNYHEVFMPRWEGVGYWYPKEFLETLSRVWGYWHYVVPKELKPVIAVPLLKVSRYFSYSDEKISKTYKSKRAVEKVEKLLRGNWRRLMVKKYWEYAERTYKKINEYKRMNPKRIEVVVEGGVDSLTKKLDRNVRLMITSPPYLQAQEYIRSFKLELTWLGYGSDDLRRLASLEIPYNNPPPTSIHSSLYHQIREQVLRMNHNKLIQIYDAYFHSLITFLNNNYDKVDIMAIFVGPVKLRELRVPIDEILREHLESLGLQHEETLIDKIVARRMFKTGVNPATGLPDERTPTEHLLIMRR
ncbi:MAG: DNA methyltransferase [Sulfolobales archaeon]